MIIKLDKSENIWNSDRFFQMPKSKQLLYLNLFIRTDKNGIVKNGNSVLRIISAKDEDFYSLYIEQIIKVYQDDQWSE